MNVRSGISLLAVLLLVALPVFNLQARGTSEDAWEDVDGKENWQHEFDITEERPGVHNIIIRGEDYAGNQYIEGPINIRVDPESDLPTVRTIFPEEGQIVRDNINLVGVAVDDDAVDFVEIRHNDGPWDRADGSEYWRYYIDADSIDDGEHTVSVRGTDIYGTQGYEFTTKFVLDTEPPVIQVHSHENGQIVSGRVRFEGVATDANGIARIALSTDGGQSYEDIRVRYDRSEDQYGFRFDVRTTDLEDGAHINWIKAVDNTGAESELPFLFFVDNESPDITVYSPQAETPVHGKVRISGSIRDEVGVERFWYEYDGEEHEIPLIAGNPFWSIEIDVRNEGGRWADVRLYAVDSSGNETSLRHRMANDQDGAKPRIVIVHPENLDERPTLAPDAAIYGYVEGVHTPDAVVVTGMGDEARDFPAGPGFRIPLADVRPGSVDIRLSARDELGIIGEQKRVRFTRSSQEPSVVLNNLRYGSGPERQFFPGMVYDRLDDASLTGTAHSAAGVDSITAVIGSGSQSVEPRVRTSRGGQPDETVFEFELPRENLFGIVPVTITVVDNFGVSRELNTQVKYRDTRRIETDPYILIDDTRIDSDGTIRLKGTNPVQGRVIGLSGGSSGEAIQNLRLEPQAAEVSFSSSGNAFTISPASAGVTENIYIRAETPEGIPLEAGPYRIEVDRSAPIVEINQPDGPDIQGNGFQLEGRIRDTFGVARAEYSIDGGVSFAALNLSEADDTEFTFSTRVNLGESPQDGYGVVVRAYDRHGNTGVARRVVNRLPQQPLPPAEERRSSRPEVDVLFPAGVVGAAPQIGGFVRDIEGTSHIEMALPDQEFRRVLSFDERRHHQDFIIDLPALAPGTHDVHLRAVDRTGEESRDQRVRITVASGPMDISLSRAGDSSPVRQGFTAPIGQRVDVAGTVRNAERLDSLRYRFNDGEFSGLRTSTGAGLEETFELRIPNDMPYGQHELYMEAVDQEGNTAEFRTTFFVLSAGDPPVYSNELYFRDDRVSGTAMRFGSTDELIGFFHGRQLQSAELEFAQDGGDSPLAVRVDGNHLYVRPVEQGVVEQFRITMTTVDGLEYQSPWYSAIIDFEPPQLTLDQPSAGRYDSAEVPLTGRVTDGVELAALEYRLGIEGSWRSIEVDDDGSFDAAAQLSVVQPGAVDLFVRASDSFGNTVEQWVPIGYDPDAPEFRFVTPAASDVINGLTSVASYVESRSPIVELGYSLDGGETFQSLPADRYFVHDIDFTIQELGGPQALEPDEAVETAEIEETVETETMDAQPQPVIFRAIDAAGNIHDQSPPANVDLEMDLPVVDIQVPADGAIITSDFTISGMAFDDDGIKSIHWRIDDDEFQELPGGNNFAIDIPLDTMTDNEHTIEMYAVDVYGLQGEMFTSEFHISLAEPNIQLSSPPVEETNRGTITLEGTAFDENGIDEVWISMDNGNTFQLADGGDFWTYELDTTVYTDGTFSLQVRAFDNYGIEGNYFTLVNIDNTPPFLDVATPEDAAVVSSMLELNGRVEDNVSLRSVTLQIESISRDSEPLVYELDTATVLDEDIDIEDLDEGWYNLRITAVDQADNTTVVARNVLVQDDIESSIVSLLFPRQGSQHRNTVVVEGRVVSPVQIRRAQLYVNDAFLDSAEVNSRGYFRYEVDADEVPEGENTIQAFIDTGAADRVSSGVRSFSFEKLGPSVVITSNQVGDFVSNRPWLRGTIDYNHGLDEDDRDNRQAIRNTRVDRVLVSLDNGRTFEEASGGEEWRYRIETADIPEGPLSVVVRAEFRNGETAVARSLYTVDKTPPLISLLSPSEGARLNTEIQLIGTGEDEHGIKSIQAALRPGDKAGYAVPGFVQGMYIDTHFLGLTYYQIGLGLTFFDQNVKLQGHFGPSPEEVFQQDVGDDVSARLGGMFYGGKLLANVTSIPFNIFFGPDWEFVSLNLALGASFNYVQLYNPVQPSTDGDPVTGVVLSAIVGQLEFPKITIENWGAFNAYSLYMEPQVWFISSDVSPDIEPKLTFGARMQLF